MSVSDLKHIKNPLDAFDCRRQNGGVRVFDLLTPQDRRSVTPALRSFFVDHRLGDSRESNDSLRHMRICWGAVGKIGDSHFPRILDSAIQFQLQKGLSS